jgi:hypothetical protein
MTKEAYERRKAYQREFQRRQKDPSQRTLKETPRERAIRRKAEGVCTQCGGVLGRSTLLCDACQDKRNQRQRIKRAKLRTNNLCMICKKPYKGETGTCDNCRTSKNDKNKESRQALKLAAFDAYGGRKCSCCGEDRLLLLTIDHVNNDGNKHRREMFKKPVGKRRPGGTLLYSWLKANNYPPGFQVLCWNCNMGKHLNGGVCPHKELNP